MAYGRVLGGCIFLYVRYPCTMQYQPLCILRARASATERDMRDVNREGERGRGGGGELLRRGVPECSRGYRDTLLIRKRTPLGPYRRPMPRVLKGSWGGGCFLMGEVPLYLHVLAMALACAACTHLLACKYSCACKLLEVLEVLS